MPQDFSRPFKIDPPLLNSANPWATTIDDLCGLYNCPYTGAITVRTSLLKGFAHNPQIHQYTFFAPSNGSSTSDVSALGQGAVIQDESSSLNTLGYSPIPLPEYLDWLISAAKGDIQEFSPRPDKPIILSVTGSSDEVAECYTRIAQVQSTYQNSLTLYMEINLSCPNIPNKPPPAYDEASLITYLDALQNIKETHALQSLPPVHIGIKTPPYTYQGQFNGLINALLHASRKTQAGSETGAGAGTRPVSGHHPPISFITATNTLGSCLVFRDDSPPHEAASARDSTTLSPALCSADASGVGGMAGSALHPLALGNVRTIRRMLDACCSDEAALLLRRIEIIGVGGVGDGAACHRMMVAGASAVGVGTALGRCGVKVFETVTGGFKSLAGNGMGMAFKE